MATDFFFDKLSFCFAHSYDKNSKDYLGSEIVNSDSGSIEQNESETKLDESKCVKGIIFRTLIFYPDKWPVHLTLLQYEGVDCISPFDPSETQNRF